MLPQLWDFIPRSGRALLAPVIKSTFERRDDYQEGRFPLDSRYERDHRIWWAQDLGRSLDYLVTRSDIDKDRVAYVGMSWGAALAPVFLAGEERFKAAILVSGGLDSERALPEVDPFNFLGHVHLPVLMLNGRYDNLVSVEASQRPMFVHLGTAPDKKKHILYDSGHLPPRQDVIRDSLSWLDAYLGPVAR